MMFKSSALLTALFIAASAAAAPIVEMQTSQGKLVIELDQEKAPITVKNFVQYARDGFYDGTVFHRVIDGFMIQGGGFDDKMAEKKTRGTIKSEAQNGLKNQRGTLAMARRPDPDSASSQFFINLVDNSGSLDYPKNGGGYTVFGKVTQGMEVVDKIAKARTGNAGMHQNVPVEPIVIQSVKIVSEK